MIEWKKNYDTMREIWNTLPGSILNDEYKEYTCYCSVVERVIKVKTTFYCRKCGYPVDKAKRQ